MVAKASSTEMQAAQQKTAAVRHGPPLPTGRKRHWATKSNTGCLGCRVRRVKCDELRPKCKSCVKRNMACHYELNPIGTELQPSGGANVPRTAAQDGADWLHALARLRYGSFLDDQYEQNLQKQEAQEKKRQRQQHEIELALSAAPGPWLEALHLEGPVPVWLVPEGWQAFEAVHFPRHARKENTVVHRDQQEVDLAESVHRAVCRTEPYNPSNDIIVANTLCARISHLASLDNTPPKPTPASMHLWIILRQKLSSSIATLSRQITDIENVVANKILQRICDMSAIEHYLGLSGARAHFRGFLAILRRCGTPIDLAKKQIGLGNAIHLITLYAVVSNSVTRLEDNFDEVNDFTDTELIDVYRLTLENDFPCPSLLFEQILKIAKLRSLAAKGLDSTALFQHAKDILNETETFSPDEWQETYLIPKGETAILWASLFKKAVCIYCCACLPRSAVGDDFANWSSRIIAARRSELLRLLAKVAELRSGGYQEPRDRYLWPIAVAGFAARQGTYSERASIARLLNDMGYEYGPEPVTLLRLLQKFWAGTEESWDECWDEPVTFFR